MSPGPGSGLTPPGKKASSATEPKQAATGPDAKMEDVPPFPEREPTATEIMLALQQMSTSLKDDLKQVKEKLSAVDRVETQIKEVKVDVAGLTERVANLERKSGVAPSGARGSVWASPNVGASRASNIEQSKSEGGMPSRANEERERELMEMEKKQVYVNGFPYATDKKNIIEKLESIVKDMKDRGEEIQVKCNLIKSSFGILVFPSNVERESFLRTKWSGADAMVDEKYEDRKLRYSRPSTKEDRHIGRCLAKAKRAMCEMKMPSEEIAICRRGKRVWWGNSCVARYDMQHNIIKFEKEPLKDAVDIGELEKMYSSLMEKSE